VQSAQWSHQVQFKSEEGSEREKAASQQKQSEKRMQADQKVILRNKDDSNAMRMKSKRERKRNGGKRSICK